ncbi:hypothetical protein H9P43_002583 [Blastocladiella emersonii ATCC 22665]|nr:hypothetical protein H9P43_002583 [Blastocladiella emersonii ATCC 22665]
MRRNSTQPAATSSARPGSAASTNAAHAAAAASTSSSAHHALDLPRGAVESVVAILEDAMDQLTILGEISGLHYTTDNPNERRRSSATFAASPLLPLGASTSAPATGRSAATETAVKTARERAALHQLLATSITELRRGHVSSLVRAVEEEKSKRNLLFNTLEREREAAATLRDLQRQLADEQKTLDRERRERDGVIQQLREAIQEIQALTASEQKYLKRETRAHEAAVRQKYLHQESALVDAKRQLEQAVAMEDKAHATAAEYLHRQRAVLDRQIQEWMARHEEDTETKAAEIDALKAARTADVDRYEELVAKYEELERLVDEDRARRAREADERRQLRALERKNRAAKLIQTWYRGILAARKPERKGTGKKSGGKKASAKKSAKKGKK